MSEIPSYARVVIIGGGAVGVSSLYHLAKRGWTNCVLLEKNELTSGSTWHAAGNVPTFSTSWSIMNMQRYSAELYLRLGDEVGYPMNYHVTGSLRLAHTAQRMQEFERVKGMGKYQRMDLEILDVTQIREMYPFLETSDIVGALYDPNDGDIDPAQLTQAFAKGARDLGAKIIRFCPVKDVRRDGGQWIVTTPKGQIKCDYVVNAAGYRAAELGRFFGRKVPMMVMSHQYILFEEMPELVSWSAEHGRKLPMLRDVDSGYYLRQEKHGMNLGPYEQDCKAHWHRPDDPMPDDFSFQLYPDDLERLEWHLNDAAARVPILGNAGLSRVINGPIPSTPDANPLLGPMPGVPNAFEACVFTFGIAQAGGAGKILCEWIVDGGTEWDMWSCDPRRFTDFTDDAYCVEKGMELYANEYAIHFPKHVWPAGRNRKKSPTHDVMEELGAQFGPYAGWERANWYAAPDEDTSEPATKTFARRGPWYDAVKRECIAVRDAAGILDLPGFSRYEINGAGARGWLSGLITGRVPSPGRIGLAYFADDRGRIATEVTIVALAEEEFLVITAAAAQWHDRDWLVQRRPAERDISIEDVTTLYTCHLVTGPHSRDILGNCTNADLHKGWLTHQTVEIAGKNCRMIRVSFAGELGWEIHSHVEDAPEVFKAVWTAGQPYGLRPFGMYAMDSLRLEKGYKGWKSELVSDYTILEAGLDRFIAWDKPNFVGKSALSIEKQHGVSKQFVTLVVDSDEYDAPENTTVWHTGKIVGLTTSGGYGHRVNSSLALAMVPSTLTNSGTEFELEIFGKKHRAVVAEGQAVWDNRNERIRA